MISTLLFCRNLFVVVNLSVVYGSSVRSPMHRIASVELVLEHSDQSVENVAILKDKIVLSNSDCVVEIFIPEGYLDRIDFASQSEVKKQLSNLSNLLTCNPTSTTLQYPKTSLEILAETQRDTRGASLEALFIHDPVGGSRLTEDGRSVHLECMTRSFSDQEIAEISRQGYAQVPTTDLFAMPVLMNEFEMLFRQSERSTFARYSVSKFAPTHLVPKTGSKYLPTFLTMNTTPLFCNAMLQTTKLVFDIITPKLGTAWPISSPEYFKSILFNPRHILRPYEEVLRLKETAWNSLQRYGKSAKWAKPIPVPPPTMGKTKPVVAKLKNDIRKMSTNLHN